MVEEMKGDSYVVDITPPGKTFPLIKVSRRSRVRPRGRIATEEDLRPLIGDTYVYDDVNIDETARLIGRVILDDSEIIRLWKANRP